jgi:L-alanine-DL-glutamate epimerase-like enolase superfamily enzyme
LARTIRVGAPEEMAEDALNFKEQGYKMLTIKVGEGPNLDIPRVATVRKAVGDDFPLEVDASGGFTAKEAIRALKQLEEYNIKNVEQPCLGKDLDGMAEVAAAVDVAVIADESAVTVADVMEIARKKAADIICLKPAKSGGVYICKKMAAVAEAAGLRCSIGSRHPFGVGAGAILHLVASTPCARPPLGYGSPLERLVDDIIVDPIVVENGEVHVPEGPGMGVVLDEQKLKKYSIASPVVVTA